MNISIINDCRDDNAKGRITLRCGVLFNTLVTFVGVSSDLEASGSLIDLLDALSGEESCIIVNVAPRNGEGKKWKNGTPFCYFWFGKTLVLSSMAGKTLSLVKKLRLVDSLFVLEYAASLEALKEKNIISAEHARRSEKTQFRSFDFLPFVCAHLLQHGLLPSRKTALQRVPDSPEVVWWVDNFGNCKTTLFSSELNGSGLCLQFYKNLSEVPDGEAAVVEGSSGFDDNRILEVVVQGGNASSSLGLTSGSSLAPLCERESL